MDQLRRMLAYDAWANARALESVRSVSAPSARLLGLLAHVFSSKRMWLGRIEGTADASLNTWPQLTLQQSVELESAMRGRWEQFAAGLDKQSLAREVTYVTAAGDPGMQTVGDIFAHKFLHAMYHRGQLALLVREEGGVPASTDFVVWAKATRSSGEPS